MISEIVSDIVALLQTMQTSGKALEDVKSILSNGINIDSKDQPALVFEFNGEISLDRDNANQYKLSLGFSLTAYSVSLETREIGETEHLKMLLGLTPEGKLKGMSVVTAILQGYGYSADNGTSFDIDVSGYTDSFQGRNKNHVHWTFATVQKLTFTTLLNRSDLILA